jgi:beta-phosphoglucomutase-like phosphatase (HAD superfamily)
MAGNRDVRMTAPRAILIELEGVLVETHALRRDALVRALDEMGASLSPVDFDDHCHGLPVRAAITAAITVRALEPTLDATDTDLAAVRAEANFMRSVGTGLTLVDGAREALAALRAGAALAIVTRASRRETDAMLAMSGMEFEFDCVICSDDVPGAEKPEPLAHQSALARLSRRRAMRARDAIALEDGRAGIVAARRAGVPCVAVGNMPAFRALDADGYLPTLRGVTLESLDALGGRGDPVT